MKKFILKHIIKLLKTKEKEKIIETTKKMSLYLKGKNSLNDSRVLIRNHRRYREMSIFFRF